MKRMICLSLLLPLSTFAAGGTVENAGDTIVCRDLDSPEQQPPPDITIPGQPNVGDRYSLDYVLARGAGMRKGDFHEPADWEESRRRIEGLLEAAPKLKGTFVHFAASTDQIEWTRGPISTLARPVLTRKWEKWNTILQFREYHDSVPSQCVFRQNNDGQVARGFIYQRTILRTQLGTLVRYRYSKPSLNAVAENSPLQLSFMLVHEWLWDHTKDIGVNRRVNTFLHSREADGLSAEEIQRRLKLLGLEF